MFDIPSTKLKPQLLIFILNQKNISVNYTYLLNATKVKITKGIIQKECSVMNIGFKLETRFFS